MGKALCFYHLAYDKIASKTKSNEITTKNAKEALAYAYRIPKPSIPVILKELEALGWITWEKRDLIILNRKPKDMEHKMSDLYEEAGMW